MQKHLLSITLGLLCLLMSLDSLAQTTKKNNIQARVLVNTLNVLYERTFFENTTGFRASYVVGTGVTMNNLYSGLSNVPFEPNIGFAFQVGINGNWSMGKTGRNSLELGLNMHITRYQFIQSAFSMPKGSMVFQDSLPSNWQDIMNKNDMFAPVQRTLLNDNNIYILNSKSHEYVGFVANAYMKTDIFGMIRIGYRWQNPQKRFIFRVGLNWGFGEVSESPIPGSRVSLQINPIPVPDISVGWSF
jgi:hypothetical protein